MPQSSYLLIDLRGYTRFIANESSRRVISTMNRYYQIIEQVASGLEGVFCSTLGDTTGTWFTGHQHAIKAVKAAIGILKIFRRGHFPLTATAGIDSGQISRRDIKTPNMQIILPVGRPAVAAYRLEDLAAVYGSDIIITNYTYNLLSNEYSKFFHSLGSCHLKGIDRKFIIFGTRIT